MRLLTHFSDEEVLHSQHHFVGSEAAENDELLEETERVLAPLARQLTLLGRRRVVDLLPLLSLV